MATSKIDLRSTNFSINTQNTSEDKRNNLYSIPNQNTTFLYNAQTNSSNLDLFKIRATKNSKGKAQYLVNNTNTAIIKQTTNTEITLDLGGKISRPTKNISLYIFHKLGLQNITTDLFEDLFIEFPLHDLVDIGMYKNMNNARQGFYKAIDELTKIRLKASVTVGKSKDKKNATEKGISVMFTNAFLSRGTCIISLNQAIKWHIFALQSYALIPKTYWSLQANAQDLFYNIFSKARQEKRGIKDNSICFNMSFRYIQEILNLPEEKATKNPKRDIIEPILKAVEECQTKEDAQKENFILKPIYNTNGNIKDFLDGYLQVTLKDFYVEKIIEIANNQNLFIEKQKAKTERIKEQAQARVLADKIKKEEK